MGREQMIVLVLGGVASGKSEFLKNECPADCSVFFRPGRVLRESAGTDWMINTTNPNAPIEADHLVLSMFRSFLRLAGELGRVLVCDGFPRTVAQAITMRDILDLADCTATIDVKWMLPTAEMAAWMLDRRGDDHFDVLRFKGSMEDSQQVIEWFRALPLLSRMRCRIEEVRFGLGDRKASDGSTV